MGRRSPLLGRTGGRSPSGGGAVLARQVAAGWLGPQWLERQADPGSPSFVPVDDPAELRNLVRRNWTPIGTLDSAPRAVVDPAGLVTPDPGGWSLDWWIGAEDRWHLPSREPGIRQALLGSSPVVETRLRVPGGDALHRAYCVRAPGGPAGGGDLPGDLVVVEIENASNVPFAVALAVRPYGPTGAAVVERIALRGNTVEVDGRAALLLPKAPGRSAGSDGRGGDSADIVFGGLAGERFPDEVRCGDGLAQAAFLFPLAHRATLRVALPLDRTPRRDRRPARAGDAGRPTATGVPDGLPDAGQVASGWDTQTRRGMQLDLPDARLQAAVEANRRYLLVLHDPRGTDDGADVALTDLAHLLRALGVHGFHHEVAETIATYPSRQRADGSFVGEGPGSPATGAALAAIAGHWALTRDDAVLEDLLPVAARGLAWLDRAQRRNRADASVADRAWWAAGMAGTAALLSGAGEAAGAAEARRAHETFHERLLSTLESAAVAGPVGAEAVESLAACWPLDVVPATHPALTAAADEVRMHHLHDGAVRHGLAGLGTARTLLLAGLELAAGDHRALERLRWLLEAATPTWTWPSAVHPRTGGGTSGPGHDQRTASLFLAFVRDVLVRARPGGLALAPLVPDDWFGRGWEVHDAPTESGRLSYAVRWHGERPALLWELRPHAGSEPVRIHAPGLDPEWWTEERSGEALLRPVVEDRRAAPAAARPGAGTADAGGSFG